MDRGEADAIAAQPPGDRALCTLLMWVISDRLKNGQLGNWLEEKILPALELRWRPY